MVATSLPCGRWSEPLNAVRNSATARDRPPVSASACRHEWQSRGSRWHGAGCKACRVCEDQCERAGMVTRIWAAADLIHVLIGGTRVKTVRSHLSVNDLAKLVAADASNAGPSPLPPVEDGDAVEVERAGPASGMSRWPATS